MASFEPYVIRAYRPTALTKTFNQLAKSWVLQMTTDNTQISPVGDVFYVLGNGNTYAYGYYTLGIPGGNGGDPNLKGKQPIVGASELALGMKGYIMDSGEFSGITLEDLEDNEYISPEAKEGILKDYELGKTIGLDTEALESVLPEAVRHAPMVMCASTTMLS